MAYTVNPYCTGTDDTQIPDEAIGVMCVLSVH